MAKQITISVKEYERLLARVDFLEWLEAAGVDNWVGFGEAHEMMREANGDEDDDE